MSKRYQIVKAEHLHGLMLRLTYADGAVLVLDFSSWLHSPRRTPNEKRYRNPRWFARVKLHHGIALHWGDVLIGMDAEDLRKGNINGVAVVRQDAAAA